MLRNVAGEEHTTLIPCLSVICDRVRDLNAAWQSPPPSVLDDYFMLTSLSLYLLPVMTLVPSPGYDSWLMTLPTLVLRKLKSTEEESQHLPQPAPARGHPNCVMISHLLLLTQGCLPSPFCIPSLPLACRSFSSACKLLVFF